MPLAVVKLLKLAMSNIVTVSEITQYAHKTTDRSFWEGQSRIRVFNPEETYRSSKMLIAAIIKNRVTKPPCRISLCVFLRR